MFLFGLLILSIWNSSFNWLKYITACMILYNTISKHIFTIIILNRDLRFYCRMKDINMVMSWTFKNVFRHYNACVRKTLWKAFLLLHIKTKIHGIIGEWINDSKIIGCINPLVDSNLRQFDVTYSIIKLPLCIGIHFSRSGLLQIVCNVTLKKIISIVLYT